MPPKGCYKKSLCKRGHPRTGDNLKKSGACKTCAKERYLESIGGQYKGRPPKAYCIAGHPRTPDSISCNQTCKACLKDAAKVRYTNNPRKVLDGQRLYYEKNREVQLEKARRYRRDNKYLLRLRRIEKLYGLGEQEYKDMMVSQNHRCKICGEHFGDIEQQINNKTNTRPVVDHRHDETNQVRGILCNSCNVGLGGFKDNYALLVRASEYLQEADAALRLNEENIQDALTHRSTGAEENPALFRAS